jgi:hypothetical protein
MTIHQPTRKAAASMSQGGVLHIVKEFTGDRWLVLCRGFSPRSAHKLNFSDSKPNCKACLKIKQR